MRIVIQRVKSSSVEVDGKIVGKVASGMLIFFGTTHGDNEKDLLFLVNKALNLRIFSDENDKMNLSIKEINGEILVVSQFTLYGDCLSGRRPSFTLAQDPIEAKKLYEKFIVELQKEVKVVQSGIFGSKMTVNIVNDGPITFIVDAKK